jgi:purine-binding chemotaxis protein CheW
MSDLRALVMPVGADLYAVPIDWVREVVAAPALTGLVTAPPVVLGLINLRGEIVPLLDTAALLGVGTLADVAFAAVLRTPFGPAALAATGLPEPAALGEAAGPSELFGTAGVYQLERGVAALLEPAAMLVPERLGGGDLRDAPRPAAVP